MFYLSEPQVNDFLPQGAILNWFDITAPEGYYSLNDKLQDIIKSEDAKAVLFGLLAPMVGGMMGGESKPGEDPMEKIAPMMQMMGSFTVVRLTSLMGAASVTFTKEQLLEVNAKLNQCKKPE